MIIEIALDATTFIKGLKRIEEDVFIMVAEHYGEFDGLDRELNCNDIVTLNDDDSL